MLLSFVVIFIIGYLFIALEHPLKQDKAAIALLLGMILWVLYTSFSQYIVPVADAEAFSQYIAGAESLKSLPLAKQTSEFVINVKIIEHLGDISEILFFLMGAMTIVELIDVHGGFSIVTRRITTQDKRKLLWLLAIITFFMSAVLDNLTTAIVMVMLLRKLISDQKMRWLYASIIIIAANSGGAWSPIGDVTTIMLWVKGNVTSSSLISSVFLPSLVSLLVPLLLVTRMVKGNMNDSDDAPIAKESDTLAITHRERTSIFILGIGGLIFVPIFKGITSLPPFIGVLLSLSVIWIYTEIMYNRKKMDQSIQNRVARVMKRIDTATIFFFLGILMAVAALQSAGILSLVAHWLDVNIHNVYLINVMLGLLSSVVDNVPLVAAAMGMYPVVDPATLAGLPDPGYMAHFIQDGAFWEFLSYCAGVGGSVLIIGSAAGVVVMGLERIHFTWYLKHISILALCGYLAGAMTYILEIYLLNGTL